MNKKWIIPVGLAAVIGILLFIYTGKGIMSWDGNILVITLDTTRADAIGCYGNSDVRTENIDYLGKNGIRFENCYSPVPLTLPSHCTIFTGKYPLGHGVRNNGSYYLENREKTTVFSIFSTTGLLKLLTQNRLFISLLQLFSACWFISG